MSNSIIDFSHLTPAERIELAEQLWDSLEAREREAVAPSDEQLAELRRRRATLESDGDPGEPWEAVLDQIEARNR
jgi:putative addiction module component (TIGR02574 family)